MLPESFIALCSMNFSLLLFGLSGRWVYLFGEFKIPAAIGAIIINMFALTFLKEFPLRFSFRAHVSPRRKYTANTIGGSGGGREVVKEV